jgi:hypothetical protein
MAKHYVVAEEEVTKIETIKVLKEAVWNITIMVDALIVIANISHTVQ